jgi:exonuclease SbcC
MLPVRLELSNFLAYSARTVISFEGLNLACLSGPNGAGKSSLLDAITWALWGRARSEKDDELIHLGQEEMYVIFDFRQDHTQYRVVRKRSKKGRGQGSLDFFIWDEELNQHRLISESTMRDTQNRITSLLRLDYETFVHSAFLQQGKADMFTKAGAAGRKKILFDILNLGRWKDYEDKAKLHLGDIEDQLRIINLRIEEIEHEETNEPALLRDLTAVTQQVEEAQQTREIAEAALAEVASAPASMQGAQAQLAVVQRRTREYEQDIARITADLTQQHERLIFYQNIVESREAIEAGYAQLETARQADYDLGNKLSQQVEIKDQLNDLLQELASERSALEAQVEVYTDRIQETEQLIASAETLDSEKASLDLELDVLEKRKAEREEIQSTREELVNEQTTLKTHNSSLKTEMDTIKERLKIAENADGALCPVCKQPLDEIHRAELVEQYQVEGKQRGDNWRANKSRLEEITQTISGFEVTVREIEADLRNFDALKAKQGALNERWMSIQQAGQRLETDRAMLSDLQQVLAEENFSLELRSQIEELRSEIETLGYDKNAHSEAREALMSLRPFEAQMLELRTAIESLPDVESSVQSLQERHERSSALLQEVCDEAIALQKEIETLSALVQEAQRRQAELNRLRVLERNATEKLIMVQQKLTAIDSARKRKLELQNQRDNLLDEQTIYEQLRDAFGKNGIPAMIMEAAIPELEESANKLLARMTDGRMNVRFDTQVANKTGGVRETLEILIGDELGTREYDMFSGGEGFRVNFALRIALSQFLARRAGARLQTLVIDEGFGSQDDIGRERLIEAINAIRSDFDLILIVTHLDDLRDAFPVHIEVRKTPQGSTVAIV